MDLNLQPPDAGDSKASEVVLLEGGWMLRKEAERMAVYFKTPATVETSTEDVGERRTNEKDGEEKSSGVTQR